MASEHDFDTFAFDFNRSTPSPQLPNQTNKLADSDGYPVGVNGLQTYKDTIVRRDTGSKFSVGLSRTSWQNPEPKPVFSEAVGSSLGPAPHHMNTIFYSSSPMGGMDIGAHFGLTKERAYSAPTPPTHNGFIKDFKPVAKVDMKIQGGEDDADIFAMDELDPDDFDRVPSDLDPSFAPPPSFYPNPTGFYNPMGNPTAPVINSPNSRGSSQPPLGPPQHLNLPQNRGYPPSGRSGNNFGSFNPAPSSTSPSVNSSLNPVYSKGAPITPLSPSNPSSGASSPTVLSPNPVFSPGLTLSPPSGSGSASASAQNPMISAFGEHPLGEHPSRTLFVRNINSNVEDEELITLFSQHGPIRSIYTQCKHRGFVMISYFDIRHAKNAMRHLQNRVLRRRKLDIHYSIPKENPSEKDQSQGTLVVFNLDVSVSTDDLKSIFGNYGEIKEIRETPNKKHHKFIEFYDIRDAEKAMKHLNKSDVKGKKIKIEHSRPGGARKNSTGGPGSSSAVLPFDQSTNLLYSASPANDDYSDSSQPINNEDYASLLSSTLSHLSLDPSATPYTPSNPGTPSSTGNSLAPSASSNSFFSHQGHVVANPLLTTSFSAETKMGHHGGQHGDYHPYGSSLVNSGQSHGPSQTHQILAPKPAPLGPIAPANWLVRKINGNFKSYSLPTSTTQSPASLSPIASRSPSPPPSSGLSGNFPTEPMNTSLHLSHLQHITRGYSNSDPPAPIWNTGPSSPRLASSSFTKTEGFNYDEIFATGTGSPLNKTSSLENFDPSSSHGASRRRSSSASQDDKVKYVLDISKVTSGEDERTTLMIKNIPNKYTQKMLLNTVNETHKGTYDFFYLPIDFKNRCNVGYAFINFLSAKHIVSFYKEFHSKKWEKFNSEKVCELTYGRIQGKQALISHFQNSSLMCEDKKCRPIIFHRPNAGEQESFAVSPTGSVGSRSRKDKDKDSNNNTATSPPSPHNQTF